MELVVLAGGIGSRFGGLKQLSPVDDDGNFILDYSVFDAIKAGFKKVIFVIKEENFEIFKETIGKRVEKFIQTAYVFQNNDNISDKIVLPKDRTKPLGTAHALLAAKEEVDENFLVINADDFYGRESFDEIAQILNNPLKEDECIMVGYNLKDTLSESGNVKRGICKVEDGCLQNIEEHEIFLSDKTLQARSLEKDFDIVKTLTGNEIVSMNMIAFNKDIFAELQKGFEEFLNENKDNLLTAEYFLPSFINDLIRKNKLVMKVIKTKAKWQGITFKEDLNKFKEFIKTEKKQQKYPKNLWK